MRPSPSRATRPAAFAVLLASLAAVGCLNRGQQPQPDSEPLALGTDTRQRLTGSADPQAVRPQQPAAFEPNATGGRGISVQNSFNRTTPGAGTGTGNFASRLPPPQVDGAGVSPPTLQGASYGEPAAEPGRTAKARPPAEPLPTSVEPPAAATLPVEASPFGPNPPKLEPPLNDLPPPVMNPVAPLPPAAPPTESLPAPVRPALPEPERPAPPMLSTPAPTPLPAVVPAGGPTPPTYVPSPTEVPIPGVQSPPKLPKPDPIRPQ